MLKKDSNPGTWVLSDSFPMNTNMTRFRWFSKSFVLWTKVALGLERLMGKIWQKKKMRRIKLQIQIQLEFRLLTGILFVTVKMLRVD